MPRPAPRLAPATSAIRPSSDITASNTRHTASPTSNPRVHLLGPVEDLLHAVPLELREQVADPDEALAVWMRPPYEHVGWDLEEIFRRCRRDLPVSCSYSRRADPARAS